MKHLASVLLVIGTLFGSSALAQQPNSYVPVPPPNVVSSKLAQLRLSENWRGVPGKGTDPQNNVRVRKKDRWSVGVTFHWPKKSRGYISMCLQRDGVCGGVMTTR